MHFHVDSILKVDTKLSKIKKMLEKKIFFRLYSMIAWSVQTAQIIHFELLWLIQL